MRRHYNGFGQLTQEQGPDNGWRLNYEGCTGEVSPLPEIDVDYAYDGLGRQVAVSVPHAVTQFWPNRPANWTQSYTGTIYDALGRVTETRAPNGEQTLYSYSGRATKVVGVGRNGFSNKVLEWTETDGLGNLRNVRTADADGVESSRVTLSHDALGNLKQVTHPLGQTTVITYDLGGRKTQMADTDLGVWSYSYNRQGQLKQQTDACGNVTTLGYDNLGRLVNKGLGLGTQCPGSSFTTAYTAISYTYDAGHGATNRSLGQLTGVSYNDGSYTKTLSYNGEGQLASETLRLSGAPAPYTSTYSYDAYDRPLSTTYPDGEVVQVTGYNSRGLATGLASTIGGTSTTLVDCASYDQAGRLVGLRYAGGGGACSSGGVYVGHYYYGWLGSSGNSNGRYRGMAVGTSPLSINVAATEYGYDSFGNVTGHVVGSVNATRVQSDTFTYDEQNRITSSSGLGGNGQSFGWQPDGRLTNFNGNLFAYNAVTQTHAVNTVGGFDLFDYNANGSMSMRYKGTGVTAQTLRWDSRNQLAQVSWGSPQRHEYYGYDEGGRRVAKGLVQGSTTTVTFYPFAHYEQTGSGSAGVVKYYFFGGERFAMRTGSGAGVLRLLFKDRISSTVHVTDQAGNMVANTGYYPFGVTMRSTGTMPTDRRFTDQQLDGTGLYYYGARYYDPNIGHFISPDAIVPDPAQVIDYQRYAYARGNPLKYNDPTGHQASCTMAQDLSWDCNDNAVAGTKTLTILELPTNRGAAAPVFSSEQLQVLGDMATQLAQTQLVFAENGDIDWQVTLESGLGEILSSCGKVVQGACGASLGGSVAVVALGVRGSVDVVVDQQSDVALYGTAGGGGYAVFSGLSASGRGLGLFAVYNATVDDLNGWSVQFGGSANAGTGVSAEWLVGKNSKGEPWHGAIISGPMNFREV